MRQVSGLSLIELLVTMALMLVVGSFALPLTSAWFEHESLQTVRQDLQSALEFAATEAVVRGENMRVEPIDQSDDWSHGIALRTEAGQQRPSELIHQWVWSGCTVTWRGFASNRFLRFAPDLSQSALNGRFHIQGSQNSIDLSVDRTGRLGLGSTKITRVE